VSSLIDTFEEALVPTRQFWCGDDDIWRCLGSIESVSMQNPSGQNYSLLTRQNDVAPYPRLALVE
jgi:hypothetical protein